MLKVKIRLFSSCVLFFNGDLLINSSFWSCCLALPSLYCQHSQVFFPSFPLFCCPFRCHVCRESIRIVHRTAPYLIFLLFDATGNVEKEMFLSLFLESTVCQNLTFVIRGQNGFGIFNAAWPKDYGVVCHSSRFCSFAKQLFAKTRFGHSHVHY